MIDENFQFLACYFLNSHLDKLQKELVGARTAEDIESVHQSRVATRRLRAGLNFFDDCFAAKKTKKWLSQIRKMTKKLGSARDRDVQIKFAVNFASSLGKEQKQYKAGINRLLLRLRQSREKIQPKVVRSIDAFSSAGVLADMHGEIEKILFQLRDEDITPQSGFVFRHCSECIKKQLDELLSHQDSLKNPSGKNGIHQMRISSKRLRYTLEICDIAFEGELKEITRAVKETQTYLGDIHDCDVWEDYIEQFIIEEKQRAIEYYGHIRSFTSIRKGLDYFRSEFAKRHDILYDEFMEFWSRIDEEGLWDRLQSIINARLEEYQQFEPNLTA